MYIQNKKAVLSIFALFIIFLSGGNLLAEALKPQKHKVTKKASVIAEEDHEATLKITSKGMSVLAKGTDNTHSTETDTLIIPAKGGKVTAKGHYKHHGTAMGGYTLSGPSRQYGYVKNNELILTEGEWFFGGKSLGRVKHRPVHIPLEDNAKITQKYSTIQPTVSHSTGIFILKLKDTQVWEVTLTGYTSLLTNTWMQVKPDKNSPALVTIDYDEKAIFNFTLKTKFTIKKRKGIWHYKSGTIEKASVNYVYSQTPKTFYKILSKRCPICDTFSKVLEGKSITGEVIDNHSVKFNWPNIRPVLTLNSKMLLDCMQDGKPCKGSESNRVFEEEGFLDRASGHVLPVAVGGPSFSSKKGSLILNILEIKHNYRLKRLD